MPERILHMDNRPIGVFDSGLGGMTVLSELKRIMPSEDIIYFGDSGRAPYGTKSRETVIKYTFQDINFLLENNIKMIVIACNTASACSMKAVTEHFTIPVTEVVKPGAGVAVKLTRNGRIGVIGTPATVESRIYESAIKADMPDAVCFGIACPMFVPLVEEGWWDNEISEMIARKYLTLLKADNIDTLILGCTHYPLLHTVISKVMGNNVTLINSALEVAKAVKTMVDKMQLANGSERRGTVRFYTSDSIEKFKSLGSMILQDKMDFVEKVDIERY
ncbi:MAG: glutamate racemase [Clostridiales bacterium]|nr:glutamate racemase [Clostridiales bacterium]